jgi:hypothetical protein
VDHYTADVRELGEEASQSGDLVRHGGGAEAEHDDPGEPGRRIAPDVGEVEVESDEDPLLLLHGAGDIGIGMSSEALIVNVRTS